MNSLAPPHKIRLYSTGECTYRKRSFATDLGKKVHM